MLLTFTCLLACALTGAAGDTLDGAAAGLEKPGSAYTSGPLWVWNDLLSTEQIETTLDALAASNIRQVWVHPRPGLMTPYLDTDWFARWADTLRVAKKHDMLVWIYDENSYPTCFAGGLLPEAMPESRALGLKVEDRKRVKPSDPSVFAVYKKTGNGFEMIAKDAAGDGFIDGEFVVVTLEQAKESPWYGGKFHTDLLRPGVTEKFLEITLDAYKKHFGDEFGRRIPGSFYDEPHLKGAGEMHWTPDFAERFQEVWGRDFMAELPLLKADTPEGRRFRHNYFHTLNRLFIERWAKKYFDYCELNGLEATGHYWEHEWPNCASVPDNMAMSSWQQRPGIDTLFNQYNEGPHAQFGNVRAVLEVASVASQAGRARTLCELYGGSGAEMRFEDYKRIGDWLQVLGVNTLNEHLSDVTLRGARKRDYPPTFSYHSPWFEAYGALVDYFSRVTWCLTQGGQVNEVLVLEPTTTAWMHHFANGERLAAVGDSFQALVTALAKAQAEFDLGSEAVLADRGAVETAEDGGARFRVGNRAYAVVVVPENMETLDAKTVELLKGFLEKGGVVLSCAGPDQPSLVDGAADARCAELRGMAGWRQIAASEAAARIRELRPQPTEVVLAADNAAIVYHHRRQLADGEIVFIVNTSNDASASGSVVAKGMAGVREAVLDKGGVRAHPFEKTADGVSAPFTLGPCGSLMLFLDKTAKEAAPAPAPATGRAALAVSDIAVSRADDNVLILDYVDVTADGETLEGVYWKKAADHVFKKNGLRGNIWDHCVQFRDELLKTEFPQDSGFEATYHFTLEGPAPDHLFAVVERADLYEITCNGKPVAPEQGHWWLDRAFPAIPLAGAVKQGENTLTVKASPMTVFHELEAAYLVGDFALKPAGKGFLVVPSAPLGLGEWKDQGLPFFGHRMMYTATVQVDDPKARHLLTLPDWSGVVATVTVNGQPAGPVYLQPAECAITGLLNPGAYTVSVLVYGSLRNPLGPHLGNKDAGLTHPGSWNNAPESPQPAGSEYAFLGYGLRAPFTVERLAP